MSTTANAIWQKFRAQPPGLQFVLSAALLLSVILLMIPDDPEVVHTAPEVVMTVPQPTDSQPVEPAEVETQADNDQTTVQPTADAETGTKAAETDPSAAARLVLIIDDIGYNAEAGQRAINLPGQLTYAVIPFTPHGRTLANSAFTADKEVMLHAPMSNLSGMDLGPGGLTLLQTEQEFRQTLQAGLADIPHIKGVNNHTGSELTAAQQPMQWVMQELKQRGLYFVDSVTTSASVAATTAEQFRVPSLRRHVFLDNIQTADAIDHEFKRALAIAQEQGYAVAIGHPYPETLAYLEQALPQLAQQNITLISASAMIAQLQQPQTSPPALAEPHPTETTAAW